MNFEIPHTFVAPQNHINLPKILLTKPQQVLQSNEVYHLQPILSELLYGNFQGLTAPQLLHVLQLLQFTAQYFAVAQDHYATELERLQMKNNQPQFTQQSTNTNKITNVAENNQIQLIASENAQLKQKMAAMEQVLQQLPKCHVCQKQFINEQKLQKHIQQRHQTNQQLPKPNYQPNQIQPTHQNQQSQQMLNNDYNQKYQQKQLQQNQNRTQTENMFEISEHEIGIQPIVQKNLFSAPLLESKSEICQTDSFKNLNKSFEQQQTQQSQQYKDSKPLNQTKFNQINAQNIDNKTNEYNSTNQQQNQILKQKEYKTEMETIQKSNSQINDKTRKEEEKISFRDEESSIFNGSDTAQKDNLAAKIQELKLFAREQEKITISFDKSAGSEVFNEVLEMMAK